VQKLGAKILLLGMLGLLAAAAPPARDVPAETPHATGLIPLDAKQLEGITATWPRVTGVALNPLGFGRVNEVRAARGLTALDASSVAPLGSEVRSALPGRELETLAAEAVTLAADDLPKSVDNSKLRFFPPIRSQGSLGSCASFASTYVQLSYMTAFQRNLDIRDTSDNTNKYSPKWSYNMLNDGVNEGSSLMANYALMEKHGAATWADLPYDSDFKAWSRDGAVWRRALGVRTKTTQYVRDASTANGLFLTKELLADGYIVVYGTYISSWVFTTAGDDPSTTVDDPAVGRSIAYWVNGSEGSHAMTIVGYNDEVWTDINGNHVIDPGEKGAFRIANTWGPGWYESGFTWLAYDALLATSAVAGGPSTGRIAALQGDMLYVLTARDGYTPLMTGEFTINHAKRNQLKITLGRSNTTSTTPSTTWTPSALQSKGGAFAFDGTTTAVDGTFVLDFTDILAAGAGAQRYYLGVNDSASGDPATLSAFKIVDATTDPDTEAASSLVPQTIDAQQGYAYVDYVYAGSAYNDPPELSSPSVSPVSGTAGAPFTFQVRYRDADGDVPTVKNLLFDGTAHAMSLLAGQQAANGYYSVEFVPVAGSHSYSFYFEDGHGESARSPVAGSFSGPAVYGHVLSSLSPSSGATGGAGFTLVVNGSDFASGMIVTWDGSDRTTTFVSSTRLEAAIPASDLAVGKTVPIVVRNAGGVLSNVLNFSVNNPAPVLSSINPTTLSGGGTSAVLTVTGTGFVSNATVRWNGVAVETSYVGPTEVRASLSASDIATSGDYEVTVVNPQPGGGASVGTTCTVTDFTMAVTPADATVAAGHSATFSVVLTPRYGPFDAAIALGATGLPRGAKATFSPSPATPGSSPATVTLTITTTARGSSLAAALGAWGGRVPPALAFLLVATALLVLARSGRSFVLLPVRRRLAAAALVLVVLGLAGCGAGGGGNNNNDQGTPAGTYAISIQATSGNLGTRASVNLTVE